MLPQRPLAPRRPRCDGRDRRGPTGGADESARGWRRSATS